KNDVLRPIPVNIKEITNFQVYNRNGELVFQTRKHGEGWDGVFRGKPQPGGVYVWIFGGIDSYGNKVTAKGTSVLIR
ncbi:MAG TPA: gliding motility-associated C-terminal domain-containing protein, partial [Pedobacter sp.]